MSPRRSGRGKVFDRSHRILRNRINDLAVLKPLVGPDVGIIQKLDVDGKRRGGCYFLPRYIVGKACWTGDGNPSLSTTPADDLPGYREKPDALAGRDGLDIRDEIRMVRPGFYLGRAYMKKVFVLNFTLYNGEVAEKDSAAFQTTRQGAGRLLGGATTDNGNGEVTRRGAGVMT